MMGGTFTVGTAAWRRRHAIVLFVSEAIAPSRLGLKVVRVGTEKVIVRLELNLPDQANKKAAFAALSAAIEATAAQL